MRINLKTIDKTADEPLHQQLANLLRGAIKIGVYKPGDRVEPERQFMNDGALSCTTVSRAFKTLAEEGLIVRRTGSGTFVADNQFKPPHPSLATIGVFYYQIDTPYFETLFSGIRDECSIHGIDVIPAASGLNDESELETLHHLEQQGVDGIICIPLAQPRMQAELRRLFNQQMPVVTIEIEAPQVCCDAITFNYEHAGYEIAHHLLQMGHRRIVMVCQSLKYPHTMNFQVQSGINDAYKRIGEQYDSRFIYSLPLIFRNEDQRLHEGLVSHCKAHRPTAIICTYDGLARYVLDTLHDIGIRVPEQISVTGLSDAPLASQTDPPLTTVSIPLQRAGREAVRRLLIQSTSTRHQPVQLIFDTTLVVRRSTTIPPAPDRVAFQQNNSTSASTQEDISELISNRD